MTIQFINYLTLKPFFKTAFKLLEYSNNNCLIPIYQFFYAIVLFYKLLLVWWVKSMWTRCKECLIIFPFSHSTKHRSNILWTIGHWINHSKLRIMFALMGLGKMRNLLFVTSNWLWMCARHSGVNQPCQTCCDDTCYRFVSCRVVLDYVPIHLKSVFCFFYFKNR